MTRRQMFVAATIMVIVAAAYVIGWHVGAGTELIR